MSAPNPSNWRTLVPFFAVGFVALAIGLVARFKSLGAAPLAVDEFFIIQSVRNVLQTGFPAFDCGGWYPRGLLIQYLSAALELGGVSETVAPRFVAAFSSVLALPAVFAIARRAYNPTVGLIVVSLLLASIWEIEIARFGRMYTPFQAVTAWYVLYFLRYTVDRRASAFAPMVLLSFLGILTWEGGVLLAAANFLPMFLVRERVALTLGFTVKLAGLTLLVGLGYWLVVAELRVTDPSGMLPEIYTGELFEAAPGLFDRAPNYLPTLFENPLWLVAGVVLLVAGFMALRTIAAFRARPLAALGLLAATAAALCGQFAAVATILVLLVLFRMVDWAELLGVSARGLQVALGVCLLFWLAFVAVTFDWGATGAGSFVRGAALFAYQFARFPDFVTVALWPWARSVPILGLVLFVALVAAIFRVTRSSAAGPLTAERALLAFVLCMLAAAALSGPPRLETRYTFFLYPLVLVLATGTLWNFVATRVRRTDLATALAAGSAFAAFAVTEDFDLDHVLHVDRPSILVREEMTPSVATHFVPRSDTPAMVRWLDEHVVTGRDVVITGYHPLDFYYSNVASFFVDSRDEAFREWSCRHGTIDRWTNKPLLYTVEALEAAVPRGGRAFLVVFDDGGRLLSELAGMNARVVWSKDVVQIIAVERS